MKPELLKTLLQLVLLTLAAAGLTLAGKHLCPEEGQKIVIDITDKVGQSLVLVPQLSEQSTLEPEQCNWKLTVTGMTTATQLLLMGAPPQSSEVQLLQSGTHDSSVLQFQLHRPGRASRRESVFPGMTNVIALTDRETTIDVYFKRSVKVHGPTTSRSVNLKLVLPKRGFCSRDMLSFNGSCHAVSPLPSNVTVSMSNIRGDAQLASFISMSQVNSFIAANEARRDVHPYRRALNLSQAVRLGMFYSATDATILSVVRIESGCVLQAVERPEEMLATAAPVTGACGSLRVDESGRAVMEFGDCSKPMLSLMSFPETASSTAAVTECSRGDLAELVRKLERRYLDIRVANLTGVLVSQTTTDPDANADRSPVPAAVWIAAAVSVSVLAVAAGLALALVVVRRRRSALRKSLRAKLEEPMAPLAGGQERSEPDGRIDDNYYS